MVMIWQIANDYVSPETERGGYSPDPLPSTHWLSLGKPSQRLGPWRWQCRNPKGQFEMNHSHVNLGEHITHLDGEIKSI